MDAIRGNEMPPRGGAPVRDNNRGGGERIPKPTPYSAYNPKRGVNLGIFYSLVVRKSVYPPGTWAPMQGIKPSALGTRTRSEQVTGVGTPALI